MPKTKRPTIYVFIDSQNLNLGTSKHIYKKGKRIYTGWKLDYQKFYVYLRDKFRIEKAFIFIGYMEGNQILYQKLKSFGYQLVFKPTVKDNHGKAKGNIDAELVLHSAVIEYDKYDQAIFVSGDGDFYCLYEYLRKKRKLYKIIIPNSRSESSLLKNYAEYKVFVQFEKNRLKFKP